MVRFRTPVFAFVDDDLAVAFYVEIDKGSIRKNDPQAKAFHADLFDCFALHRFEGKYSFRLGPDHDFECITGRMPLQRCIDSETKKRRVEYAKRPAAKWL